MYNMQVSTTAPQTDSTPTVTDSQQPSNSNILYPGMLTSDFPMIDMGDLHIENEIVVQSSSSISPIASSSSANTQLPQQNILASPESDSSIIVTTQSELIMNDDNMYQESFQNTHMVCNDNNNSLTTMIEQQPQSPPLQHQQSNLTTEIVMAESSFGSNSDLPIEQKKDHQENKVILSGRVSDTLLQNIVASIPNSSLQIQSQQKSHDFKPNQQQQQQIHQMPQSSMIKVNVSNQGTTQRPPMFVNQPIIGSSNVQTIQNSMGNISYILPSSNISKQAIVNKASTLNLVSSQNIVGTSSSPVFVQNTSQQLNVDNNSSNIPKCNANFRLIQTSQGQQLVLSPIKSTSFSNNNIRTASTVGSNVTIKPSTSKIFTGTTQQLVSSVPNLQQQQQQLIILSPVKGQNIATKPTFLPATSVKILPNPNTGTKMQNIAPAPAKRILAPAGSKPMGTIGSSAVGVSGIGNKPIQTLVHSNNKNVHYISFVPVSTGNQLGTQAKLISANPKYLPLKPMIANKANFTTTSSSTSQGTKSNVVQVGQKVLINPSSIKISSTVPASSVVSSTTVNSSHSSANKRNPPTSIWMLPKQQVIKIGDNPLNTFHVHQKPSKFIPIAPNPVQANSIVTEAPKTPASVTIKTESSPTETEEARRRPCNCTRSQCLKLYCDCFANGEFCNNCNCVSCYNNLEYEEVRQKAIRLCLERNPNAFHPKIGQSNQGDIERRHTKGCNCKRSGCLKNYCECYEAKILCSDKCKCNGCKNFEESTERKTLMHLADAAEVRSAQQSVATKMHIWGPDLKPKLPIKVKSDCHPFNIFTMDILEATASCLLAQGEEGEFENYNEENVQSLILDQFGECLSQILNLSTNGTTEDLIDGTDDDSTMNDYENS